MPRSRRWTRCRDVAIDFHSNARRELEFDFRLAPGADLSQVAYRVDGADKLEIDTSGTLHLFAAGRELMSQPQPLAFEVRDGKNIPLTANYVVSGTTVGFTVAGWTGQNQLVIDPVVAYGSFFGVHDPMYRYTDEGGPNTWGLSTAVDPLGNMYIAGQTMAFDIPITPGAYMTECPWTGAACVYVPLDYVAKLSASGSLLYSTYLGGDGGIRSLSRAFRKDARRGREWVRIHCRSGWWPDDQQCVHADVSKCQADARR